MWVYEEEQGMVKREATYVPGLYKIFDEILVNAADNKQRDPTMDTIKVDIKPEEGLISIMNNGKGIPVEMHKEEKMYVPTMIFGHLLTGSNFNDDEARVTGGRNGFGAKLCNVFSSKFTVETADKNVKKHFKQTWGANMTKANDPKVKDFVGEDFTKVTFQPDLAKFGMTTLDADTVAILSRRAFDVAASSKGVKVFLNGKRLPVKNFKEYVEVSWNVIGFYAVLPFICTYLHPCPPAVHEGQDGRVRKRAEGCLRPVRREVGGRHRRVQRGLPADQLRQQHRHPEGRQARGPRVRHGGEDPSGEHQQEGQNRHEDLAEADKGPHVDLRGLPHREPDLRLAVQGDDDTGGQELRL